jgi:hypothetical protein
MNKDQFSAFADNVMNQYCTLKITLDDALVQFKDELIAIAGKQFAERVMLAGRVVGNDEGDELICAAQIAIALLYGEGESNTNRRF